MVSEKYCIRGPDPRSGLGDVALSGEEWVQVVTNSCL